MPIEFDDRGLRIIGNNVIAVGWYDDARTLRQAIYLKSNNTLNIGDIGTGVSGTGTTLTGDGAPAAAQYLVMSLHDKLPNCRRLDIGSGLTAIDHGASADYDLSLNWGTPTIDTIQPDDTAAAGSSTNPARSDHTHGIVAAAAGTIEPDASAAEGAATSFARSDHTHGIVAAAASTLTVATTNAEGDATSFARSNHIHTITSSSNPGAAAAILASDASGYLQLVRLGIGTAASYPLHVIGAARIDGDLTFVGAQSILTTADSLTLAPAADLDLTPGGTARVRTTSGVRIQSDNYVSQTTGWGISYAGSGDFRYLYADELHAKAFIADLEQALAGGQIICKSVAPLAANFTAPAAGGNATLVVESFKGFATFRVFVNGDMVRLREFARAGTSLSITNCWGTVVWVSTDETAKTQTYTFTRSAAPNAGAIATDAVVAAGTLALDYGTTGNGFLESNAIDGAMAEYAPYHQVVSWATHPNSGLTVRTRLGNLKGIFNVANEYGLYAGAGITDASQYLRISNTAVEAHNLPIKMYDGASVTMYLDPTVPSLAMGSTVPTAFGTNTGLWMGKDTVYKWRVGNPAGIRMAWDGTALGIYDAGNAVRFRVDAAGAWLSTLALSPELGDVFFSTADGMLLLGPGCPITPTSWTSLRKQTATLSGAFRQTAGRWAGTKGIAVEPAGTTLIVNPSFEVNVTDGWTLVQGGAGATIARVTDRYIKGVASARLVAGNSWALIQSSTVALGNGRTIIGAAYGYRNTAVRSCDIQIYDTTNSAVRASLAMTRVGAWERIITPYWTNATGGTVNVCLRVVNDIQDSASSLWIDGCQLEFDQAYVTSYMDGSLAWCDWTGPAHNSTSTRAVTQVNLDVLTPLISGNATISYVTWVQMPYDADAEWPGTPFIFDLRGADSDNRVTLAFQDSTNKFTVWNNGAWDRLLSAAQTFSTGDWMQLVLTFDYTADDYNLYIDGVLADNDTTALTAPTAVVEWNIGTSYTGAQIGGFVFSEYAVFDRVLTAAEVAAMYAVSQPLIDAGAMDVPGLYILDGKFQIASSTSTTGFEITAEKIVGKAAGVDQVVISAATGKLTAGAGKVVLDASGIILDATNVSYLNFKDGATLISKIWSWNNGGDFGLYLNTGTPASTGKTSFIQIGAYDYLGPNDAGSPRLSMLATDVGDGPSVVIGFGLTNEVSIKAAQVTMLHDLRVGEGLYVGGTAVDPATGDIWCTGLISTDGGTTKWELGAYTATVPTVDGYVTVVIEGTTYRIAVDRQ